MKNNYKLFKHGFEIRKIENSKLSLFKKLIHETKKVVSKKFKKNNNLKLENIHESKIDNFNEFRLDVIKKINKTKNLKINLFKILEADLTELFGKDIVIQKFVNFGVQKPNDVERTPMHSDSPSHSKYEVVIWIPLVNCKKTMGLYFFPLNKTHEAKNLVINGSNQAIEKFAKKSGINPDVKLGEFVIFLTKCFHYIPVNKEKTTRWSINVRFKNTFTPYSKKGFLDYYEPISYSAITERALNEKK